MQTICSSRWNQLCLWSRLNIGITDLTAHGPKWGMTQLSECGNLTTALKFLSQVLGSTVSQIPQFWLFNLEIVCNTPQFGNEILQQPNRGMRKNVMMVMMMMVMVIASVALMLMMRLLMMMAMMMITVMMMVNLMMM